MTIPSKVAVCSLKIGKTTPQYPKCFPGKYTGSRLLGVFGTSIRTGLQKETSGDKQNRE
jgi:hypothetical protein